MQPVSSSPSFAYYENRTKPAHERLEAIFKRILSLKETDKEEETHLFHLLNVHPTDHKARLVLKDLMQRMQGSSIDITPAEEACGMFNICEEGVRIGVAKIGADRASKETIVRYIAHLLGLEDHVIPMMFGQLTNPEVVFETEEEEGTVETLFNDKIKVFLEEESEEDKHITCVLEPRIEFSKKNTLTPFGMLKGMLLALAITLRDASDGGFTIDQNGNLVFIDVEDSFSVPNKTIPLTERISPIDFPFLDNYSDIANTKISASELEELKKLAADWKLMEIMRSVDALKIRFADLKAETMDIEEEGIDEGGYSVRIEKMPPHLIHSGKLPDPLTDPYGALTENQMSAILENITRLKHCIDCLPEPTSPSEFLHVFSPQHAILAKALRQSPQADRIQHLLYQTLGSKSPAKLASCGLLPDLHNVIAELERSNSYSPLYRELSSSPPFRYRELSSPPPSRVETPPPPAEAIAKPTPLGPQKS